MTKSPVNTFLRNSYRVFNHADLANEKISIAKKWELGTASIHNMPTLDALHWIADKHGGHPDDLKQDILKTYRTGLLELHITDVCDLDCVDCHYRHKGTATVPYQKLAGILRHLSPCAITITGGGEPNVYRSEGKTLNDVVLLIHEVLPDAQIGLINNNSHIPVGTWPDHLLWQRSSIDAASEQSYHVIKRRDKYLDVVANVEKMLNSTTIPFVGIGYLYRQENVQEIMAFLEHWYVWYQQQSEPVRVKFNIQFRPISPPIEEVVAIRNGQEYLPAETLNTLRDQVNQVELRASRDNDFAAFLATVSNFSSVKERAFHEQPFVHTPEFFSHCYNALIHRVFRSDGSEYPDFLLCAFSNYCMGNTLCGDEELERLKVALAQFRFYARLEKYCNANSCRQGWVSHLLEQPQLATGKTWSKDNCFF